MATTIFLVNPYIAPTVYLLDTYSAAAAYSLRQLKTGVTSVVRVRRSSDNAEQDFTATEVTDGTLTTFTGANDGFVVTWYDQVGAKDVVNSTASLQPKIVSSGSLITLNSLPSIDFSNDILGVNGGITSLNTEPFSLFSVWSQDVNTSFQPIFTNQYLPASPQSRITQYTGATSPSILFNVKNTGGTAYNINALSTTSTATAYLGTSIADASKNMEAFLDGTSQGTSAFTGTYANTSVHIGGSLATSQYLNGKISEVIVFGTDESSNRTTIETDINTYYSIY